MDKKLQCVIQSQKSCRAGGAAAPIGLNYIVFTVPGFVNSDLKIF